MRTFPSTWVPRDNNVGIIFFSHVLLTRRARHMRTFPSTWVPPGGHIDPGETLMEAALRSNFSLMQTKEK